jgi:cyclopropane-fatty-acyl-phospholipid synthase
VSAVDRALRPEPRAFGVERVSQFFLERALPHIEGGTLVVRLPDGTERSFGSGRPVMLSIESRALFRRLATRGKIGFGESYQAGEWRSDDLVRLFELLLRNAESASERHPRLARALALRPSLRARNGLRSSRRNIAYHYDLGNDFFELFLDGSMTYSCAVFDRGDEPLALAQRRKHEAIADKLDLGPGDRLLEIGCGWGSFAVHAARERGAHVTALTISPAQARLARERVAAAGLADRIEILEEDFRTHQGRYSKIASIEMIEAIGERSFPSFFAACDRLLERGGIACIQSILVPDPRYDRYRSTPDWIERYVFPGCLIPSLTALTTAMTRASRLQIHDVQEIGPHYAETLRRWRERFLARIDDVRRLGYDGRFVRTWDFYLAYCEAAFRTRSLRNAQLVLTRPFNEGLR